MAIEQQMEMFNANPRGGLDDDGLKRDPVSGNEIPPGSMANEVRDDVEARLSDGEYVVPANVVRFFGVKFFEDLRTQAMQGLGAMEANGRIGGEPVPSAMPMQDQMANVKPDMSDGEMEMLQGLMNEGGFIRGYAHGGSHETPEYASTAYNPLQYPLTQYATPGASVYNPNLNPNVQALEQTQTAAPTPAGSESTFVTFVNPRTGTIQVLQYINGEPANIDAYNALTEQGFFVQGGPELAAYNEKLRQDDLYDPAEGVRSTPMGADPEELVNIILESGGMELPGLGGKLLSGVMGGSKVYQKDIDAALEHIIDKGTRSVGQNALRDAAGNIVFHTEGPLKGKVMREQEKVSPEMVAYLTQIKEIRDGAKKDGTFDRTLFRDNMITAGLLTKEDSFLGSRYKTLTQDEINTKFKSTGTKTKPKGGPVAAGATSGPAVDKGDGDVTPEGGAIIKPSSGPSSTLNTVPLFLQPVRKPVKREDADNQGGGPSGPTATQGGGMTGSDDRPDDPRGEGQYGGGSNSQPSSNNNTASSSGPTIGFGGFNMNKGGLLNKPTKKKHKRKD